MSDIAFGDVTFDGYTFTIDGDLDVEGDLTIEHASDLNGGEIRVAGDVTTLDTSVGGSATVVLDGAGDQVVSANGGVGELHDLRIDKPGGTVTLQDHIQLSGDVTHVAGDVNASDSVVEFQGTGNTIDVGEITFGDVIFDGYSFTLAEDLDVGGDLTVERASSIDGGTINVVGETNLIDSHFGGTSELVQVPVPTADAGPNQVVEEGDTISLAGSGTHPEGAGLTYRWVQTGGPSVELSDPSAPTPTFEAPEGLVNTDLTFEIQVSDGTYTSMDSVTITVEADDDGPSAEAGTNQIVHQGATVTLTGTGADPEGQEPTYMWVQTDGPSVELSDPTTPSPSFELPADAGVGAITFELHVSDGENTSVDTVTIFVVESSETSQMRLEEALFGDGVPDRYEVPGDSEIAEEPTQEKSEDTNAVRPTTSTTEGPSDLTPLFTEHVEVDPEPESMIDPTIEIAAETEASFESLFVEESIVETNSEVQDPEGRWEPAAALPNDEARPERVASADSDGSVAEAGTGGSALLARLWGILRGVGGTTGRVEDRQLDSRYESSKKD